MHAIARHPNRIPPSLRIASAVEALHVYECKGDVPLVAIPRPQIQVVARFGVTSRNGLDVHAMGIRQRAHRKCIRRGQRSVTARLYLGATEAVLGAPASTIVNQIVALEDLWGDAAGEELRDRLSLARDNGHAAAILEGAITERFVSARMLRPSAQLAFVAADKLTRATVNAVADDLGVSERHLRRIFREALGVSPKAFSTLSRFHRALSAAREEGNSNWASIAAASGYYDQAHLIADFRSIAGVTPRELLSEMNAEPSII